MLELELASIFRSKVEFLRFYTIWFKGGDLKVFCTVYLGLLGK